MTRQKHPLYIIGSQFGVGVKEVRAVWKAGYMEVDGDVRVGVGVVGTWWGCVMA